MYYNFKCPTCFQKNSYKLIRDLLLKIEPQYLSSYFDLSEEDDDLLCSCQKKILPQSFYVDMDNFYNNSIRALSESISSKIDYCFHCEGAVIEQLIKDSSREKGEYDLSEHDLENLSMLGNKISKFIFPLLDTRVQKDLLLMLYCQNCGFGYNRSDPLSDRNHSEYRFYMEDGVYSEADIEKFYDMCNSFKIRNFASDYAIDLKYTDLIEFSDYLKNNNMLGSLHRVGRLIYELLLKHYRLKHYVVLESGRILFRGRNISKSEKNYVPDQMWNPPQSWASHGRYNPVGSSVLYCCDSMDSIPYEINTTSKQDVCIADVIIKESLKMLDIDRLFYNFNDLVRENTNIEGIYNSDYSLTNFIAQCCKEIGYNGILYKGVRGENYINYALLNFKESDDLYINYVRRMKINIRYDCEFLYS
ncbi:RES domain-containing protein [Paenibacillus sp. FSL R7-0163]|uniref:RES domain-containing protein n=1 Tax=Paenibacillus sp. FSL R7-0163 TaxID=2954530 RepID=UPI0030D8FE7D